MSAYPLCVCGHRYDHHRDESDPRGAWCYDCARKCIYQPVDSDGVKAAQKADEVFGID